MAIVYRDNVAGKVCTKCKEWKPLARVRPRKLSRDGYNSICRDCENEKAREWRAKHRERVAELNREFYEANRQERLAYHKQYRQENPDYFTAKRKEFRANNPDYHRDAMREWSRANTDKVWEKDRRRRAAKMNTDGSITKAEWEALKRSYNYTCLHCRQHEPEIKLTLDHVVPLSKGGTHSITNCQPLCKACNTIKRDKTIDYRPDWRDD